MEPEAVSTEFGVGDIAVGEGGVWITPFGDVPVSREAGLCRVDPADDG